MSVRDEAADLVIRQNVLQFWSTVRFFAIGWLIVFGLSHWFRFVAVIGVVAFGLLLVWNLIRTAIALATGIVLVFTGTSATRRGTEAKFWTARVFVLAETVVYAIFVWLLYAAFFA